MTSDLRETVNAAIAGDAPAFDSLFARNLPHLHAFLRLKAGGVVTERESISDLAQSVCREVLSDLDSFEYRGEREFRNFLLLQATRKILKRYRYHHREKRDVAREVSQATTDEDARRLIDCYATILTPSRHAAAREEVDRVEAAMHQLPDEQRDAVAMSRIMGLSYAEIAAQLGKSESAARGLVARGLAKLTSIRAAATDSH